MKKFFDNGKVIMYVTGMADEHNNDYGTYEAEFNDTNERVKRCIVPDEGPDIIYDDSDTRWHSSEKYDVIAIGRYDIPFLGIVIDVEEGTGHDEVFDAINVSNSGDIIKEIAPKCDLDILSTAISYYSFIPIGAMIFNGSFLDIVERMYWVEFNDDAYWGMPHIIPNKDIRYNGLHRACNGEYYKKPDDINDDSNFYGYSVRNYVDENGNERTGIYLAKWIDWEC